MLHNNDTISSNIDFISCILVEEKVLLQFKIFYFHTKHYRVINVIYTNINLLFTRPKFLFFERPFEI